MFIDQATQEQIVLDTFERCFRWIAPSLRKMWAIGERAKLVDRGRFPTDYRENNGTQVGLLFYRSFGRKEAEILPGNIRRLINLSLRELGRSCIIVDWYTLYKSICCARKNWLSSSLSILKVEVYYTVRREMGDRDLLKQFCTFSCLLSSVLNIRVLLFTFFLRKCRILSCKCYL